MLYGVILAAGIGSRMKSKTKKQYLTINDKSVLEYSIEKFLLIKSIKKIIIVINKDDKNNKIVLDLINKYKDLIYNQSIVLILGGKERYDSVYNALNYIHDSIIINPDDKIIIHDSARPNVNAKDIKELIKYLNKYDAITLGYKLSDSIKKIKKSNDKISKVVESVDRDNYYLIATPQGFNLELLYKCYNKFYSNKNKYKITDDLQMIEYFSKKSAYILDSSKLNYKITTKEDINMLQYII